MHSLTRHAALLATALTLSAALSAAQAAPLRVSASGTYTGAVPASFFTAPGSAWSYSFIVDSEPSPLTSPAGITEVDQFTTVPFTDFEFRLDGVLIAQSPAYIAFYNATFNSGGVDIFFNDSFADPLAPTQALAFYGPQMYSGSELDPTMLPGTYTSALPGGATGFDVVVDGVTYQQARQTLTITPVSAPGSAALAAAALALVALRRRASQPVAAIAG